MRPCACLADRRHRSGPKMLRNSRAERSRRRDELSRGGASERGAKVQRTRRRDPSQTRNVRPIKGLQSTHKSLVARRPEARTPKRSKLTSHLKHSPTPLGKSENFLKISGVAVDDGTACAIVRFASEQAAGNARREDFAGFRIGFRCRDAARRNASGFTTESQRHGGDERS